MANLEQGQFWRLLRTVFACVGVLTLGLWAASWAYAKLPIDRFPTPQEQAAHSFASAVPETTRAALGDEWVMRSQAIAVSTDCFQHVPAASELERAIEHACDESRSKSGLYMSELVSLGSLCDGWDYQPCTTELTPSDDAVREIDGPSSVLALSTYEVECEFIIDFVDVLPDEYVELADTIAVPVLTQGMQVGRRSGDYRFSKFGMAIRQGLTATVTVDAEVGDVYLDHGAMAEPGSKANINSLGFAPCPTESGSWVIYAGGIWTTTNGCVTIAAETGVASEAVTVGVGAPC